MELPELADVRVLPPERGVQPPAPVLRVAAIEVADGCEHRDQAAGEPGDGRAEAHHGDVLQAHEEHHGHEAGEHDVPGLRRLEVVWGWIPCPDIGEQVAVEVRVANAAREAREGHGENRHDGRARPDVPPPGIGQRATARDRKCDGVVVSAEERQAAEDSKRRERGEDAAGGPAHHEAACRRYVRKGRDDHDPPLGGAPHADLRRPDRGPPAAIVLQVRGRPPRAWHQRLRLPSRRPERRVLLSPHCLCGTARDLLPWACIGGTHVELHWLLVRWKRQ
mmetsp:Transcript_16883/g.46522  ORF Transcript_16883/g.46522 Transcript_16883/m.46522 type:complete len:278 (-) Transcript_16883:116-949(-)